MSLARVLGLLLGLLAILGYADVGRYYGGFRVPQGYGMNFLLPEELAHIALFSVLGLAAVVGLSAALAGTDLTAWCVQAVRGASRHGVAMSAVLGAFVLLSTFGFARYVLGHAAITDDEHVYRFIAQTLRHGSVTAPSPGVDLDFFREQFVVLTPFVRYGKYPLGHPLLLAAGQALGVEAFVVPLASALLVPALFWVGSATFDRTTATVATLLLASSPQLLATGATLFSQPAAAACLIGAMGCLLRAMRGERPSPPWLAGAGALLGYGVLVRPLPGVLFALAALWWMAAAGGSRELRVRLRAAAVLAAPVVAAGIVLLLVNRAQTGGLLSSGYQAFHAPNDVGVGVGTGVGGDLGLEVMSVVASLLRVSVWLTGWPGALLFLFLARGGRARGLVWAMIAAEWLYRLVSPKAGVGGAGPLYLFEVLPLLCLLVAGGLVQLARTRRPVGPWTASPSLMAALVLAGAVVNLCMFLPVKALDLRRMAEAQLLPGRLIRERGLGHALVFHNGVVPPSSGLSWAYFPPCNSPALDDDVLWVRVDRADPGRNLAFWKQRFPERSAWYYRLEGGKPLLQDLESFLERPASLVTSPPGPTATAGRP